MWICEICGNLVEEPGTFRESRNYFGFECEEVFDETCECGGDFVMAKTCKNCGEYCDPCDLTDGLCPDCVEDLMMRWSVANDQLHEIFTDDELRFLYENLNDDLFNEVSNSDKS